MSAEEPSIYRPVPRRPFDLPGDSSPITATTPVPETLDHNYASDSHSEFPQRSRSAVSLTGASTLFGIYGKTYTDEPGTPSLLTRNNSFSNVASLRSREEAEAAQHIHHHRKKEPIDFGYLAFRIASLFAFGVAYGIIVTHLHDRSPLSPVKAAGMAVEFDRWSTTYLVFWGLAGVGLGSLLPWLDGNEGGAARDAMRDWNPAVRSIGAFVGIAYAIRRLPWQSTLQVSLALALVNPFLWFILDRTSSGFWFATLVGIAGTAFLLQISPEMMQTPETPARALLENEFLGGLVSVESIAVGTWIASVLFCSCVCFGNIGRKLASKQGDA